MEIRDRQRRVGLAMERREEGRSDLGGLCLGLMLEGLEERPTFRAASLYLHLASTSSVVAHFSATM